MNVLKSLFMFTTFFAALTAQAGLGITYHGRILKNSNEPVTGSVQFRIQIMSPGNEKCLMYQETQSHNINDGIFSLTIGDGTRAATSVDGGFSIDKVFANRGTFDFSATSPSSCYFGTSYTPNGADSRIVKVFFNDGGGWDEMPQQTISWSPYAINSHSVGGFTKDELLRVQGGTAAPFSVTDYNKLTALIQGTSPLYATPSAVNSAISGLSPLATLNPTGTASNTTFLRGDGVWATPPVGGGGGGVGTVTMVKGTTGQVSVADGANEPVISLAASGVAAGTYGAINKTLSSLSIDAFGRITAVVESPIALNANQVTAGVLGVAQGGTGSSSLTANRLLMANGLGTGLTADACVIGQILKFDGTNWQCVAAPTAPTAGTTAGTFAAGDDARIVASTNAFMIGGDTKNSDLSLGTKDNQALSFITNNLSRIKIQNNGNIGIGVAGSVTEKLEVDGKVKATEFCLGSICLSTWPTNTGTVTNVTATAPLSVSNGASTPALSLNMGSGLETVSSSLAVKAGTGITVTAGGVNVLYGTTAGTSVQGNDSRLSDSRNPTGSAGGDLGGTYPNPTVEKIQGRSVASTAPNVAQVLKWDGSAWVPSADAGITSETDPTVPSWAKGALPTCSPGQVLFANGSTISCVTVDVVSQDPAYRCDAGSVTYSSAGAYSFDMFDIPSGCKDVKVTVKGAGGGSGANANSGGSSVSGKSGGYAEFYINRQGVSNLNMVIGGGGGGGSITTNRAGGLAGSNGGAAGGTTTLNSYNAGGGGGGRTEVSIDSTLVAIVGGGGGSGANTDFSNTDAPASYQGSDATTVAIGLKAAASSGNANQMSGAGSSGGKGSDNNSGGTGGGGGGGGCYGGGGGGAYGVTRAGSGGSGSSCIYSSYLLSGFARPTGGNNGGANTFSGNGAGKNGSDGSVLIEWSP